MATVYIPAPLRALAAGRVSVELAGATVAELVAALEREFPGLTERLVRGDALAPGLAVSIDGVMTNRGLLAKVTSQSEVHFLPAIGGG